MIATETLMTNLFAIAQSAATEVLPINLISRRWRMFDKVDASQLPALFQFQSPTRKLSGGVRPLLKNEIRVLWMMYLPMSQDLNDVVSPGLNQYFDLLVNALLTTVVTPNESAYPTVKSNGMPKGSIQNLGFPGQVLGCYPDGDALTDEGLLSTYSLIVLPITILTGM
jgi:hypothetical protein